MALLLMLVLVGVSALVVSEITATARAREQETEMLWIGEQYRAAIERYWKATPGPRKVLPSSIDQLLVDDRVPNQVHHLRQKYADPFDPSQDLEAVRWNNSLVGIHSTVRRSALKRANFPLRYHAFEGAEDSTDWRFLFQPPVAFPSAAPKSPGGFSQQPAFPPGGMPAPLPGGSSPLGNLPSRR
jgi:hypothetical protein